MIRRGVGRRSSPVQASGPRLPRSRVHYTTRCQEEERDRQGIAGVLWWGVWVVWGAFGPEGLKHRTYAEAFAALTRSSAVTQDDTKGRYVARETWKTDADQQVGNLPYALRARSFASAFAEATADKPLRMTACGGRRPFAGAQSKLASFDRLRVTQRGLGAGSGAAGIWRGIRPVPGLKARNTGLMRKRSLRSRDPPLSLRMTQRVAT